MKSIGELGTAVKAVGVLCRPVDHLYLSLAEQRE
jgi:hypothetical protein